jgi:hypothetical protein
MSVSNGQAKPNDGHLRVRDRRTESKDEQVDAFPLQAPVQRVIWVIGRLRGEYDASVPLGVIEFGYLVVARILDP